MRTWIRPGRPQWCEWLRRHHLHPLAWHPWQPRRGFPCRRHRLATNASRSATSKQPASLKTDPESTHRSKMWTTRCSRTAWRASAARPPSRSARARFSVRMPLRGTPTPSRRGRSVHAAAATAAAAAATAAAVAAAATAVAATAAVQEPFASWWPLCTAEGCNTSRSAQPCRVERRRAPNRARGSSVPTVAACLPPPLSSPRETTF